jgi:HSP20 family protein
MIERYTGFPFVRRRFEDIFNGFNEDTERDLVPKSDIYEEGNNFYITLEIPGLKKEDVKIKLEDNLLVIEGEKKIDKEIEGRKYHYCERASGTFQRSFRVPDYIKIDSIKAKFDNGILTVELPKTEEEKKTREIEID